MAAAIADRIGNPDTDVTIGRGGLEITRNRHQETATETKLENAIKSNPDIEESVEAWLREQGVAVSLTSFLYGDAYTDMRDQCVTEFNLQ